MVDIGDKVIHIKFPDRVGIVMVLDQGSVFGVLWADGLFMSHYSPYLRKYPCNV